MVVHRSEPGARRQGHLSEPQARVGNSDDKKGFGRRSRPPRVGAKEGWDGPVSARSRAACGPVPDADTKALRSCMRGNDLHPNGVGFHDRAARGPGRGKRAIETPAIGCSRVSRARREWFNPPTAAWWGGCSDRLASFATNMCYLGETTFRLLDKTLFAGFTSAWAVLEGQWP